MVRSIISFILASIAYFSTHGQIGLHTVYMRHNGTAAMIFDAPLGIGIQVHGKWNNSFRIGAGLTQFRLQPRKESYPWTSGMNNGNTFSPYLEFGTVAYSNYKITMISACFDFAFIEQETYGVFFGTEASLGNCAGDLTYDWLYKERYTVRQRGAFFGANYRLGGFYGIHERMTLNLSSSFGIYNFSTFGLSLHNSIQFGIEFKLKRPL